MARKEEKKLSVQEAVALALATGTQAATTRQDLRNLLREVRKLVSNPALTLQNMKEALATWLQEGWAVVSKHFIQVTRAGRAPVKKMAESVFATPHAA